MLKITMYIVEGAFEFPTDMLRYDRAWPADSLSAERILLGPHDDATALRQVRLHSIQLPTTARWESFGWRVNIVGTY